MKKPVRQIIDQDPRAFVGGYCGRLESGEFQREDPHEITKRDDADHIGLSMERIFDEMNRKET